MVTLDPHTTETQATLRALADAYGYAVDHRDVDLLTSLFHPDGELVIKRGNDTWRYHGHARLGESFAILGKQTRTSHFVAGQFFRLDDGHATGETRCLAVHGYERDGRLQHRQLGIRYDDRFQRTDDGWVFGSRTVAVEWETEQRLLHWW